MTDDEGNDKKIVERFSNYISPVKRGNSLRVIPAKVHDPLSEFLIEELLQNSEKNSTIDCWARFFLESCLSYLACFSFIWKANSSKINLSNQYIYFYFCNKLFFLYLQWVCWETALHLNSRIGRFSHRGIALSMEDYFLMTCEISLDFRRLLQGFRFSSSTRLHAFSREVLQKTVTNQVVRHSNNKTLKFSKYGLLRYTGPSILEKALSNYGILSKELAKYKLAYQSFKDYFEQYSATNPETSTSYTKVMESGPQAIEAITKRFNSQVKRLQGLVSLANEAQIRDYLEICIEAVQNSQSPQTVSFDQLIQNSNDVSVFSGFYREPEEAEVGESQAQKTVSMAFESLAPLAQSALILWLGLGIKQSDFCAVLAVKEQFQVARKFQRYQREMLKEIVRLNFSSRSKLSTYDLSERGKEKLDLVKDYLRAFSQQKMSETAEYNALNRLDPVERAQLKQWLPTLNMGTAKNKQQRNPELLFTPEFFKFEAYFKATVEELIAFRLDELESAAVQARTFLIGWLVDNQASLQGGL